MTYKRIDVVACVSCGDTEQLLDDVARWSCAACSRYIETESAANLAKMLHERADAADSALRAWRNLAGAVEGRGDVGALDLEVHAWRVMQTVEAHRERLAAEEKSARQWHRRWAVLYEALVEVSGAIVDDVGADDHEAGERATVRAAEAVDAIEESHRDDARDRHGRELERAQLLALLADPNDPSPDPAIGSCVVFLAARLRARAEHETGVASVLRAMLAAPSR